LNNKILSTDIKQGAMLEIRPLVPQIDKTRTTEAAHRHSFQEIIFLKSGKGFHSIDGQTFKLKPNTIYLIGKGQIHIFKKGEHLKGYILRYKEDLLPPELTFYSTDYSLLQMMTNSNALSLSKDESKIFATNFEELFKEHTASLKYKKADIIQLILLTILSRIKHKIRNTYEQSINQETEPNDALSQRLILMIEDHYKTNHELVFYSKKLGTTKRKLLAITQDKFGKTPKELLNDRLITEAARLLKFTDLSLKEISFELGYSEPAYFSRFFKRKMNLSPKSFRTQFQNNGII